MNKEQEVELHLETCDEEIINCPIKLEMIKKHKNAMTRFLLLDELNDCVKMYKEIYGYTDLEIRELLKENGYI